MPDITLEQAIAQLGDTEKQIAATLREKGIRGVPLQSDCCVLAIYLESLGFDGPCVSPHDVFLFEGRICKFNDEQKRFIAAFDDGDYPDLEVEEN